MIDVPKALRERLERIARANHADDVEDGRRVSFLVCSICGFAEWCSSGPSEDGFKAVCDGPLSIPDCPRCREAFARAPELCKWVLGVLAHHDTVREEPESVEDKAKV